MEFLTDTAHILATAFGTGPDGWVAALLIAGGLIGTVAVIATGKAHQ